MCVSVSAAAPAAADDLPRWSINKICTSDSAPGQCRLFEQRARAQVAEAWITLPDKIKQGCLAEFRPPLEPSWRIMSDCVGELSVVARINVRKSAIERDRRIATVLKERRIRAEREAKRLAELKRKEAERKVREAREAAQRAREAKRIAAEEESFREQLAAQRQRDREQAERERIARERAEQERAQREAAAREREEQRLAIEEASFLKQLAANQKRERLEAERKSAAEAARKKAARDERNKAAGAVSEKVIVQEPPKPKEILKIEKPAEPAVRAKPVPPPTIASLASRKPEIVACETRLEETAKAGAVRFAFDSASILKNAEITLDALAAAVRACGRLRVVIEGHTDATGRISYNQSLSERRAENVANYLISAGVKSKHVRFIGYGERRPVASNKRPSGRAKNRRIEYRVR